MLKHLLAATLAAFLSACGGGGDAAPEVDYVRSASQSCQGPFVGSFSGACSVELRLAGNETIRVHITGRIVTDRNLTDKTIRVTRELHAQFAGTASGFQSHNFDLLPGEWPHVYTFDVIAAVPAVNLGGAPAMIGLSSYEGIGDLSSRVIDVRVQADAK